MWVCVSVCVSVCVGVCERVCESVCVLSLVDAGAEASDVLLRGASFRMDDVRHSNESILHSSTVLGKD